MSIRERWPIIYLITSGEATDANFSEAKLSIIESVRCGVEAGVTHIQIREKRLSGRRLVDLASAAASITRGSLTKLLINDRADIALATGADGVHLTTTSMPVAVIKTAFPGKLIISISTHDEDQLLAAAKAGADLALYGPVFETRGKPAPVGTAVLAEVCRKLSPFPVTALGGIEEGNCVSAMAAGAAGVAGIRSFNDVNSVRVIVKKLKEWSSWQ